MSTHTGEKQQKLPKCDLCDKVFSHQSNLLIHRRLNTGEKPNKCSQCDRYFAQKSDLTIHMRTQTGEKPHQCSHCEWKVFL